jgi:hypothetical protein
VKNNVKILMDLGAEVPMYQIDGVVHVLGSIYLENRKLKSIPVPFGKVSGDFSISRNRIKDLSNCPKDVICLDLSNNILRSLKGAPGHVKSLNISNNPYLNTILHAPYSVEIAEKQYSLGLVKNTHFKGTNIPDDELEMYFRACVLGTWESNLSLDENLRKLLKVDPTALNEKWSLLQHPNIRTLVSAVNIGLL